MLEYLKALLSNPRPTSRLAEEVGTFSLHSTQLYVGTFHDEDGLSFKAISLLTNVFNTEGGIGGIVLYNFSKDDANRFVEFLQAVLSGELPASFRFPSSETRFIGEAGQIEWTVSEFVTEWHGGGGFKGKLGGSGGHIITKESAENLKRCVSSFFGVCV